MVDRAFAVSPWLPSVLRGEIGNHGVELCRGLSLGTATLVGSLGHVVYLCAFLMLSLAWGRRTFEKRLHQ